MLSCSALGGYQIAERTHPGNKRPTQQRLAAIRASHHCQHELTGSHRYQPGILFMTPRTFPQAGCGGRCLSTFSADQCRLSRRVKSNDSMTNIYASALPRDAEGMYGRPAQSCYSTVSLLSRHSLTFVAGEYGCFILGTHVPKYLQVHRQTPPR
jgi:hypothetical protein